MKRSRSFRAAALAALAASLTTAAFAVDPDEMLDDKALEARAQRLGSELRCVVCQSESIELSNAPLAHDMRILVREQIKGGASDEEVKAFLVERYGDYVLMRPPVKPETYALWLAPLLLFGVGGAAAYFVLRDQARRGSDEDASVEADVKES